jgi:hypothetical protein
MSPPLAAVVFKLGTGVYDLKIIPYGNPAERRSTPSCLDREFATRGRAAIVGVARQTASLCVDDLVLKPLAPAADSAQPV